MPVALRFGGRAAVLVRWAAIVSAAGSATGVLAFSGAPLHASAVPGGAYQLNAFTGGDQGRVALAVARDGSIIAAWESRRQDHGTYGVYARAVSEDGAALSGEVAVNEFWAGPQHAPAVAADRDGVWISWTSYGQDGDASGVVARRFGARLAGADPEFIVNDFRRGAQHSPALASSDAGTLVVWLHEPDARERSVRGRLLASPTGPDHGAVMIGAQGERASSPCVAADPRGGFVVAWSRAAADGAPLGIVARRVDSAGLASGDEFWLDGCGGIDPALTIAEDGRLFLAWLAPEETAYRARARWLGPAGVPLTQAITLGDDGQAAGVAALVLPCATGVVCFERAEEESGGGNRLWLASVSPDGVRGDARRVHSLANRDESLASGAGACRAGLTPRGTLALGWHGDAGLADSNAANLTLVRLDGARAVDRSRAFDARAAAAEPGASPDHVPPVWDPSFRAQPPLEQVTGSSTWFGFEAVPGTSWAPPDCGLAVGPGHIVTIVNGQIAFFDRGGVNTFRAALGAEGSPGFWEPVGAGGFVFDPEVHYDPHSGRFWAMACERSSASYFCIAVSDDGDPNGGWHKYRINVTALAGADIDSPNMSIGPDAVYLTADFFGGGDKHLIYMLPKALLLAGQSAPSGPSGTSLLISGSQSYGLAQATSGPTQYLVESTEQVSNTTVKLHAVRSALTTPTRDVFALTVPVYQFPGVPAQQGSGVGMTLFEPRFWTCVEHGGSLWAAHHVRTPASGGRTIVRWYEFATQGWPESGQSPVVRQWGELDPGAGLHAYFPAIGLDDAGSAAITFARSGTGEFISMWRAVRRANDPLGAFRPMELVRASTSAYTALARWGDYGGSQADPTDPCGIWAHHQFTTSPSAWRTWVSRYRVLARSDLNEDCALSIADFGAFQSLFQQEDPRADFNGDGQHSIADFGAFQTAFAGGQ